MKRKAAEKLVKKTILDLGYSLDEYNRIQQSAIEFAEIASTKEVIKYIEDSIN